MIPAPPPDDFAFSDLISCGGGVSLLMICISTSTAAAAAAAVTSGTSTSIPKNKRVGEEETFNQSKKNEDLTWENNKKQKANELNLQQKSLPTLLLCRIHHHRHHPTWDPHLRNYTQPAASFFLSFFLLLLLAAASRLFKLHSLTNETSSQKQISSSSSSASKALSPWSSESQRDGHICSGCRSHRDEALSRALTQALSLITPALTKAFTQHKNVWYNVP